MATSGRPTSGARRSSLWLSARCSGMPWSWSSRKKSPPEDVLVLAGERAGGVPVLGLERPGDLAAEARGQADEALAVPGEVLAVDARLVVVAVDVGVGDQPAQVLVAGPVLGQEDQVAVWESLLPSRSVIARRAT